MSPQQCESSGVQSVRGAQRGPVNREEIASHTEVTPYLFNLPCASEWLSLTCVLKKVKLINTLPTQLLRSPAGLSSTKRQARGWREAAGSSQEKAPVGEAVITASSIGGSSLPQQGLLAWWIIFTLPVLSI